MCRIPTAIRPKFDQIVAELEVRPDHDRIPVGSRPKSGGVGGDVELTRAVKLTVHSQARTSCAPHGTQHINPIYIYRNLIHCAPPGERLYRRLRESASPMVAMWRPPQARMQALIGRHEADQTYIYTEILLTARARHRARLRGNVPTSLCTLVQSRTVSRTA